MPECRYRADGFTLIELMVVIAVIAIMALVTVPRMTSFFSSRSENMAMLSKLIAKTHDDSFLNNRINFLTIHLYDRDPEKSDENDPLLTRRNAVSVLNIQGTKFVENERRILQAHEFPDSFQLKEVVLKNGTVLRNGYVLIPYQPQGYSDNAVIHVLINNEEQWSVRIRRHFREPEVVSGWVQ